MHTGMWMVIRGGDTPFLLPRRERILTTASIYGKFMEVLLHFGTAKSRDVLGSGSGTKSPKGSKEFGGHGAE